MGLIDASFALRIAERQRRQRKSQRLDLRMLLARPYAELHEVESTHARVVVA
jgi:hypothetical protein